MKTHNENYTGVCQFCGSIFRSTRSDAKHCSGPHRSLRGKYGPQINAIVKDKNGNYFDADRKLKRVYEDRNEKGNSGWSTGYPTELLCEWFDYDSPLPKGSELLVVGSYLIKRLPPPSTFLLIKPIALLSKKEKATCIFVNAKEVQHKEEVERAITG